MTAGEALGVLTWTADVLDPLLAETARVRQVVVEAADRARAAGRGEVAEVCDNLCRWLLAADAFAAAGETFAASTDALPDHLADVDRLLVGAVGGHLGPGLP